MLLLNLQKKITIPKKIQALTLHYFDFSRINDKEYIRMRYRELSKLHHPDRPEGNSDVMQAVNHEYEIMQGGLNATEFIHQPGRFHLDTLVTVGALALLKWSLEKQKTPAAITDFCLLFLKKQMEYHAHAHRNSAS